MFSAATVILFLSGAASGQNVERRIERAIRRADPAERLRVDPKLGLGERTALDVGGFFSTTFVHLTDSNDNARRLFQPEVTLYARAVIDGAHTFFGRTRFQYRAFSEGDSFDERGDRWPGPFADRYWYEFDLRSQVAAQEGRSLDWNFNIRAGRQFVDWGAGLVLSENMYALRPTFEFGRVTLDLLAGVTPGDESLTDFDASRRDFNEETWRAFYGGRLAYRTRANEEFYAFFLAQVDHNSDGPSRPPLPSPPFIPNINFDYNSQYLGFGTTGGLAAQLVYVAEFVYEFGTSMSDPLRVPVGGVQSEENINAFAARGELIYLFSDRNNSRAEFETIFASGDGDRLSTTDTVGGNQSRSDDTAFNSLGFVNTGLAFSPSLSNLMSFRLGASTSPFVQYDGFEYFQVGADVFFLSKLDPDAPIDEPTSRNHFLGFETDLYVNYRITSDLAVSARYGVFFPSAAIASERDTRHFVFLGMTLSF